MLPPYVSYELKILSVHLTHQIINFLHGRNATTLHDVLTTEVFDKYTLKHMFTALEFYTDYVISHFPKVFLTPKGFF